MYVRIYPLALVKIIRHSVSYLTREVIGLLIGKSAGKYLEIWDAVTGEQYGTPAYVQLDENVMSTVAERLARDGKGLYIVGWYHSHPGLGVFLSPTDIETQKTYQLMYPKAVALVIDPVNFARTNKVSLLDFKVFQISKDGKIVTLPVSIGIQRTKLLESTLYALDTLDFRQLFTEVKGKTVDNPTSEGARRLLGKAKKLLGI